MNKLLIIFCIIIAFIEKGNTQSKFDRYLYKNEIFITGRINKYAKTILPGIGYEYSFPKNKYYLSLATEFSTQFNPSKNIGEELMSSAKINIQNQNITSFGIGLKHTFNIKKSNIFFLGSYKYDFYKFKLTFSANILFEFYKPINIPLSVGNVCLRNCPKYLYIWHLGLAVGKYF